MVRAVSSKRPVHKGVIAEPGKKIRITHAVLDGSEVHMLEDFARQHNLSFLSVVKTYGYCRKHKLNMEKDIPLWLVGKPVSKLRGHLASHKVN